jgi:hypothetical protein
LPYDIKPFKDEVLCDISLFEVFDVLLGQPYLWKHHIVYESRPHSVIITLGRKLYKIPEVAPPTIISLISSKECSKVISQTGKFIFFVIHVTTSMVYTQPLSLQQNPVDKIMEECIDIFTSPIGVPTYYQVKHPIDLTPNTPIPNGLVYQHLLMENDEIGHQIQEILQKGHIRPNSSPCGSLILLVQKKDGTWRLCIDYKALKKITVRKHYPIPRIDDLLDQINGAKLFRKIDLKSSYHHIPIEPIDVSKTTFKYKEGLYEWLVIPFGLTNAPTNFMRLMDDILRPLTNSFVVVYLDDILIFIRMWEENMRHIQQVLSALW